MGVHLTDLCNNVFIGTIKGVLKIYYLSSEKIDCELVVLVMLYIFIFSRAHL